MATYRSLIIWLLVIGLVGAYAQSYEDLSTNDRQLYESSSSSNAVNEDYLPVEDTIVRTGKARIYKRSDPKGSKSKMSKEEFEWHIHEGEKTMQKISQESAQAKEAYLSKQQRTKDAGVDVRRAETKKLHDRVAGWQGRGNNSGSSRRS